MAEIVIEGSDELVRNIAKRVGRDRVNGVVRKNGAQIQQKMMKNASFTRGYQTGFTKRSIMLNLEPFNLSGQSVRVVIILLTWSMALDIWTHNLLSDQAHENKHQYSYQT